MGAGSIKAMIDSYRNNRQLLKGEGSYKNFDKKAYGRARKLNQPVYKDASPAFLKMLREKLKREADQSKTKKVARLLISVLISLVVLQGVGWLLLHVFFANSFSVLKF